MVCYVCGGPAAYWIESWGLDPTPAPYRPPLQRAARCADCMPPEAAWSAEWGPGKFTVRRLAAPKEKYMSSAEQGRDVAAIAEKILLRGDISGLSPEEKVIYVRSLCERLGLDPLTKPFDLIKLRGGTAEGARETLYANSSCTRQLRVQRGMSTREVTMEQPVEGLLVVRHEMTDRDGNVAVNIGVVHTAGKKGEELENALKKAWTQAERRVVLSLGGLGMPDESEIAPLIEAAPRRSIEAAPPAAPRQIATPPAVAPTVSGPPTVEQAVRAEVDGLVTGGWLTGEDVARLAGEAGFAVEGERVRWGKGSPEAWVAFGDLARRLAADRRLDAAEEEASHEPDEFDLLAPSAA